MPPIPYIPETAPFTAEQRAWLNGFLAGLWAQSNASAAPETGAVGPSTSSGEPLWIMFGSQTGTAEGLAKRLAKEAQTRGFLPRVMPLDDYEQAALAEGGRLIVVSSTWGDGDPPDNAAKFWSWLSSESAPTLDKLDYAVLGLGDRNYADFCGASKKFDARLESLGGRRLLPRGECDVDYEITAQQWVEGLWSKLGAAAAVNGHGAAPNGKPARLDTIEGYGRKRPFPGKLLANVALSKPGSGKDVRHYAIRLEGSGLTYEVGDALGVLPVNCPGLVQELLNVLGARGDELVQVDAAETPLVDALLSHWDITKPTRKLLSYLRERMPDREPGTLCGEGNEAELKQWLCGREVIDLVSRLSQPPPVSELSGLFAKLAPRLYSIASSPKAHPGEVHLTINTVRYESHGRRRLGVASAYLAERVPAGGAVNVFFQATRNFKLPASGDAPIVMVGPGTGIAPFRAFLEERQAMGAKGRHWLFFGDQRRATDFLYEDQITGWLKDGHLTRLDLAFSRDQAEKVYVQQRMAEQSAALWAWLEEGASFYVCGDATRMAKDVDAALHRVIETEGKLGADGARDYVARLKREKRYQRDVY